MAKMCFYCIAKVLEIGMVGLMGLAALLLLTYCISTWFANRALSLGWVDTQHDGEGIGIVIAIGLYVFVFGVVMCCYG